MESLLDPKLSKVKVTPMKGRGVWNHNWWGDRPNDSEETKSVNIHRDWSKNIQAQFEQLRHTFRFVSCAVKKTLVKLEHPIRYIQVGGYLKIKEEEKRERTRCLGLGIDDQHRFWMKTFEQISANSLECRKKNLGAGFLLLMIHILCSCRWKNPAKVNYLQSTENFVCISSVDSQSDSLYYAVFFGIKWQGRIFENIAFLFLLMFCL